MFLAPFAPFMMVVGIVWVRSHARLEEKRIEAAALQNSAGQGEALERVEVLEDRVRVLERIVTDGGYDLAHKIEALRDERPLRQRLDTPARQETI
jgi:hypothetical protein